MVYQGHLHRRRGSRGSTNINHTKQAGIGVQLVLVPVPQILGMLRMMGDKETTEVSGRGAGKLRGGMIGGHNNGTRGTIPTRARVLL